jgi:UDP-N-acetylmuramoylalanine--D-glutamate ligase
LNSSGYKAKALGNIGSALTDNIEYLDPGEIVVTELSSYQLETMTSKVFDAAVILNITPDHLDRYKSMDEYAEAKFRLQGCMKEGAVLYVFSPVAKNFGHLLSDHFLTFGDDISSHIWTDGIAFKEFEKIEFCLPPSLQAFARHEQMNILASWILCKSIGVDPHQFIKGVLSFKRPSHRIEFVKEVNGVKYFDDSKGTNVDAVIQAVTSMDRPVLLIAGGVDKGSSYAIWNQHFKNKVKEIFVLGQAAEKIRKELGLFFKVTCVASLSEAVALASSSADCGDVVLLSPGCSSVDMFRDYAHRGNEFQKWVNLLESRSNKNEP